MKKNLKNKLLGISIILAGLLLAALGIWLASKVWGTALLYTDAVIGKIAAYYWIVLLLAVVVILAGYLLFRKKTVASEMTETSEAEAADTEAVQETTAEIKIKADVDDAETVTTVQKEAEKATEAITEEKQEEKPEGKCPKCGAQIKEGMKFCIKCGEKL